MGLCFPTQSEASQEAKCVTPSPKDVTLLLGRWTQGDENALNELVPLVYGELRRLANHHLRAERPNHTLQSTALVHEAYLRLADQTPHRLQNRTHFFAVASQLMRQILVDFARSHGAAKRNQGGTMVIDESTGISSSASVDVVVLDDALNKLSRLSQRQSKVVELRFFGGLSIDETSQVLGVSTATVERDWTAARAWLRREMAGVRDDT